MEHGSKSAQLLRDVAHDGGRKRAVGVCGALPAHHPDGQAHGLVSARSMFTPVYVAPLPSIHWAIASRGGILFSIYNMDAFRSPARTLSNPPQLSSSHPYPAAVSADAGDWAEPQKRAWVRQFLGADVPVIVCMARDKGKYCSPGAVLVDDMTKNREGWLKAGGTFVLHTSAASSIAELRKLGFE